MAHTKSPWEIIEAQRGFVIAAKGGMYDIAVVRNIGNEDNKDNARLIAAAPDLLEALELMLATIPPYKENGECTIPDTTIKFVNAAIKKATE